MSRTFRCSKSLELAQMQTELLKAANVTNPILINKRAIERMISHPLPTTQPSRQSLRMQGRNRKEGDGVTDTRDPEGEVVDCSEAREGLGESVDDDGVCLEERLGRRRDDVFTFTLHVGVFVGEADL